MQSIKHQHFEAATNILTGFGLAYIIQLYCAPWFIIDGELTPWNAFRLTTMFTCVTYLRSLFLRKWYNRLTSTKWASRLPAAEETMEKNSYGHN